MKPKSVLVMDDDPMVRKGLEDTLKAHGYSVVGVGSSSDGMHFIQQHPPDLLILELTLINQGEFNGIVDGFGFLHWLRYSHPDVRFPVIIYTADMSPTVDRHAAACQVSAVIRKSEDLAYLMDHVQMALGKQELALAL